MIIRCTIVFTIIVFVTNLDYNLLTQSLIGLLLVLLYGSVPFLLNILPIFKEDKQLASYENGIISIYPRQNGPIIINTNEIDNFSYRRIRRWPEVYVYNIKLRDGVIYEFTNNVKNYSLQKFINSYL